MKKRGFFFFFPFLCFVRLLVDRQVGKKASEELVDFQGQAQPIINGREAGKNKTKHMVGYLLSGGDKGLSPCVGKYLCCVSSEPIKVRRREVPLIWHMEEFGLILSYERRRAEFFRFIPLSAPREGELRVSVCTGGCERARVCVCVCKQIASARTYMCVRACIGVLGRSCLPSR